MQKNEIYEMTADDLTLEGNGVGRIENMAVFVPGLLPRRKCQNQDNQGAKKLCHWPA